MNIARILQLSVFLQLLTPSHLVHGSSLQYEPQSPNDGIAVNHFTSYDVTFIELRTITGRQIYNTLTTNGHEVSLMARLVAFNQTFQLILRRNRLMFSSSYVEKVLTPTTEHVIDQSVDEVTDCYYTGRVKYHELDSTVAVSTCNGLAGYFSNTNETYYIEPESGDIRRRHFVFRESDSMLPPTRCGNEQTEAKYKESSPRIKMKRSFNWPQDLDGTTRVVEIYIVNSYSQFISQKSNTQQVIARAKNILNVVNSLYESQNIYFVLIGIEVWTVAELITIDVINSTTTLNNFLTYRKTKINPTNYNDNAQLITNVAFSGGVVGKAVIGSMCSFHSSGGINSDISAIASHVGTSMAHEIGHNFGLLHDTEEPGCQCNDAINQCIMYPTTNAQNLAKQWSSCSNTTFHYSLTHGLDYCLNNIPKTLYDSSSSYCGNGIIENSEQCDCGQNPLLEECNPACCNSTTCQLVGSAKCSAGRCCDVASCQLKVQGFDCRPANGDCDLSEYCNGATSVCPSDVFKQDGTGCVVNQIAAYCYQGRCQSHQSQCQLLWGASSAKSDQICYSTFNVLGSYAGNCGLDWFKLSYAQCDARDAMCGQLLCWPTTSLVGLVRTMVYSTATANIGRSICNSVIIDVGTQIQSPAMVPNGAQCGNNKMCLSQQCVDISSLKLPTCNNNCSGQGVCNSLGQCFCNPGYDPTSDCSRPGAGGSVHGGSSYPSSNTGLIVGLCILFLVILPLIILGSFCAYKHRQQIVKRFQGRNVNSSANNSRQTHRDAADNNSSVLSDGRISMDFASLPSVDHNRNAMPAERSSAPPNHSKRPPGVSELHALSPIRVSSPIATPGSTARPPKPVRPAPPRKPRHPVYPSASTQAMDDSVTHRPTRAAPPPPTYFDNVSIT